MASEFERNRSDQIIKEFWVIASPGTKDTGSNQ